MFSKCFKNIIKSIRVCQPQVGAGLPCPPVRGPLGLLKRGLGAIQGVQELKSSGGGVIHSPRPAAIVGAVLDGRVLGWHLRAPRGGSGGLAWPVGTAVVIPRGPLHVITCRQCRHPHSGGMGRSFERPRRAACPGKAKVYVRFGVASFSFLCFLSCHFVSVHFLSLPFISFSFVPFAY